MANLFYRKGKVKLADRTIDYVNDTIKVALVTSSYTPAHTHEFFSDVTNEVTGTGYTAGGATLGTKAIAEDTSNNRVKYTAANPSWSTSTITARAAVIYKSTGTASTSALIGYVDFGSDQTSTSGTFAVQWDSNGVAYW